MAREPVLEGQEGFIHLSDSSAQESPRAAILARLFPARGRGTGFGSPWHYSFYEPNQLLLGTHQRCHLWVPISLWPYTASFFCLVFLVAINMSHFNLPFQHPQSEAFLGLSYFISKMGTLRLVLPA